MRFLRHSLLIACLACIVSAPVHAQQRSTFGFTFGYEYGAPLDFSRELGHINPFEFELPGTSQNHTGWIGALYQFPGVFGDLGLRFGLQYGLSVGHFRSDDYPDTTGIGTLFSIEGSVVPTKQFGVESTSHLLAPLVSLYWQPGTNWQLGLSFWAAANLRSIVSSKEYLISPLRSGPEDVFFRDTRSREREMPLGADYQSPAVRFGPAVSSSWLMSGGRNLDIRPELFGKLDLTSAYDLGLRAFSAGLRLNFIFNPTTARGDIIDADSPQDEDDTDRPKLTAEVRITSNGVNLSDAITAEPRSILYRRFETILPFIEIPTVTDRPRVERLIGMLGKRLTEVPASLSLAPTASDPILPEAAKEFADRIALAAESSKATNPSQHAAPLDVSVAPVAKIRNITTSGLTITSDQPALLRPFADQWIDSRYQLPPITIERYTDSRAGLKSWNVTVRQGRRMLARYSNLEGSTAELESGLYITADASSTIEPVVAVMTVTDLTDQVVTVNDTLRIRKGMSDPEQADSTIYEFLFYSISQNGALSEQVASANKTLMKTLKDQIGAARTIEIHHSPRSQKFASEILTEISPLISNADDGPEIKLRSTREVTAPSGVMAVRVTLSN